MRTADRRNDAALERRSLHLSMASNLVVGAAGIAAALASNSHAIMVDGLFSLVGFLAALVAIKVSQRVDQAPDRYRPLGYGMDAAILTTFRSFFLTGLVAYPRARAEREWPKPALAGAGVSGRSAAPCSMADVMVGLPVAVYWT